tara:strand:+ start:756 stop:1361 length:606 start_codon:yes stop_codon:yes gene_type:complete
MKKVFLVLTISSFLICSTSEWSSFKNILIPGMGVPNTDTYDIVKKNYLLREVLIWGILFSSIQNSDMYKDNYINYGSSYADTDVDSFNFQYAINVGDYESMSDYNNAMLGRRLPDKVYPQDEGYDWTWTSNSDRLKYRGMLRTSRDFDKIGDFAIAGLIVHRIVALINYNYLKNNSELLGISSNIYNPDSQTVQLELKFNL